jgi:hypothetical protein
MKFVPIVGVALMLAQSVFAQDAQVTNVRFKKQDRSAVVATYDAPREATEDALEDRLKANKLGKKRHENGFWKYEGVTWPEISATKVDVYFDVEQHKGKTVVSMLVSPGYENFVTQERDPQIIEGMKGFLTRFGSDVTAWQQKLALQSQQEAVEKANRDLAQANKEKERAERKQKQADQEREKKQKTAQEAQDKLKTLKSN